MFGTFLVPDKSTLKQAYLPYFEVLNLKVVVMLASDFLKKKKKGGGGFHTILDS